MSTPDHGTAGPALALDIDGRRPVSTELVAELEAFNGRAADAGSGSVAVIRAAGSPGQRRGELGIDLVNRWERALRRLERLCVATVTVAKGEIGGVAAEALLATDYRIGTADLALVLAGECEVTWPGMGLYRLANQVGIARIRRAVLFGMAVSAAEALELGVLDEIVTEPDAAVASFAGRVSSNPGTGLAIRRQLMLDATTVSFEDALGSHLAACDRALRRRVPVPADGPVSA